MISSQHISPLGILWRNGDSSGFVCDFTLQQSVEVIVCLCFWR